MGGTTSHVVPFGQAGADPARPAVPPSDVPATAVTADTWQVMPLTQSAFEVHVWADPSEGIPNVRIRAEANPRPSVVRDMRSPLGRGLPGLGLQHVSCHSDVAQSAHDSAPASIGPRRKTVSFLKRTTLERRETEAGRYNPT